MVNMGFLIYGKSWKIYDPKKGLLQSKSLNLCPKIIQKSSKSPAEVPPLPALLAAAWKCTNWPQANEVDHTFCPKSGMRIWSKSMAMGIVYLYGDYGVYPGLSTRFELAKIHRSLDIPDRIQSHWDTQNFSSRSLGWHKADVSKDDELQLRALWVGPRVGLLKTHQNGSSIDAKTSCSMLFRIVSSVPNSVPQITAWNVHYCPASMTERFYMMSVIPLPVHKLPSATCPSNWWFQIPRHSHLYIACLHKLAMGHGDINLVLRLWHEWLSQETRAQPQCRENGWDVLKRLYPLVI